MIFQKLVDKYFAHRNYVNPDATDALLFLISEVGELAQAYEFMRAKSKTPIQDMAVSLVIENMKLLGFCADATISGKRAWVRNNDRVHDPEIGPEVGDVYMMLDRFAKASGAGEPGDCLIRKMMSKGFDVPEVLKNERTL